MDGDRLSWAVSSRLAGSALSLPLTLDTVRLSLHVLGATVWVGGQFVLAGLLPTPAAVGDDAPTTVARAFEPDRVAGVRRPAS